MDTALFTHDIDFVLVDDAACQHAASAHWLQLRPCISYWIIPRQSINTVVGIYVII